MIAQASTIYDPVTMTTPLLVLLLALAWLIPVGLLFSLNPDVKDGARTDIVMFILIVVSLVAVSSGSVALIILIVRGAS